MIFEASIPKLFGRKFDGTDGPIEGKEVKRGAGKYSLCEACNTSIGSWYGSAYVEWARQAMRLVHASNGRMSLAYPYHFYPLRCLKQIVAMFFSACGPSLQLKHPDLVRFVLQRELRHMPHGLKVYAYLHDPSKSEAFRQAGVTGLLVGGSMRQHVFAEISFPPFGFVLTFDGPAVDAELANITHFAEGDYRAKETVFIKLPVKPVVSPFPGDFRTREEIRTTVEENRRLGG